MFILKLRNKKKGKEKGEEVFFLKLSLSPLILTSFLENHNQGIFCCFLLSFKRPGTAQEKKESRKITEQRNGIT